MAKRNQFRLILRGGLAVVVVGIALVIVGIVGRHPIAGRLLTRALEGQGISVQALTVSRLTTRELRLEGLKLAAGGLDVDRIDVELDPSSLRHGRVLAVSVRGATIRPDRLPSTADEPSALVLAVRTLRSMGALALQEVRIEMPTPDGAVVVVLDGQLAPVGAGARAELEVQIEAPQGRLGGRVEARLGDDGRSVVQIGIASGELAVGASRLGGATGQAVVQLDGERFESARGEVRFTTLGTSLANVELDQGTVSLDYGPELIHSGIDLSGPNVHLQVELEQAASGPLSVRAGGRLTAAVLAELTGWPAAAGSVEWTADASTAALSLRDTAAVRDPGAWLDAVRRQLEGRLEIELRNLGLAQRVAGLDGRLHLSAVTSSAGTDLRLQESARLTARSIDVGWLEALGLPASMASQLRRDLVLAIPAAASSIVTLRAREDPTAGQSTAGSVLGWTGRLELRASSGLAVDLSGALHAELEPDATLAAVRVDGLALRARKLRIDATELTTTRLDGTVSRSADGWDASVVVALAADRLATAQLSASAVTVRAPLRLQIEPNRTRLRSTGKSDVKVGIVTLPDLVTTTAPVELALPSLQLDRTCSDGHACTLRHQGSVAFASASLAAQAAGSAELRTVTIDWSGQLAAVPTAQITANVAKARIEYEGTVGLLDGVTGGLRQTAAGWDARFAVAAARQQVDAATGPPLLAPAAIAGTVRPEGDDLALEATVTLAGFAPFAVRGRSNASTGASRLEVVSGMIEFGPGRPPPAALSPTLSSLRDARGKVDFTLRLDRADRAASFDSGLRLALIGLSGRTESMGFEGLHTELVLDSLTPPAGPSGQPFRLDRLVSAYGTGIERIVGTYEVVPDPSPRIVFERVEADVAGGRIEIADVEVSPSGIETELLLALTGIELGELFRLTQVEGLTGEGRLTGKLPVVVLGEQVTIADGRLTATGPGVLRYRSDQAAKALAGRGQYVDLLIEALQDFHFDQLAIQLTTTAEDDVQLQLQLLGNNPKVLDGYPFQVNIGVEGNLKSLLEALRRAYGIQQDLLQQSFGR